MRKRYVIEYKYLSDEDIDFYGESANVEEHGVTELCYGIGKNYKEAIKNGIGENLDHRKYKILAVFEEKYNFE